MFWLFVDRRRAHLPTLAAKVEVLSAIVDSTDQRLANVKQSDLKKFFGLIIADLDPKFPIAASQEEHSKLLAQKFGIMVADLKFYSSHAKALEQHSQALTEQQRTAINRLMLGCDNGDDFGFLSIDPEEFDEQLNKGTKRAATSSDAADLAQVDGYDRLERLALGADLPPAGHLRPRAKKMKQMEREKATKTKPVTPTKKMPTTRAKIEPRTPMKMEHLIKQECEKMPEFQVSAVNKKGGKTGRRSASSWARIKKEDTLAWDKKPLKDVRMVKAYTPGRERSYIVGKTEQAEKKYKLVVEVTARQAVSYNEIAQRIFDRLLKKCFSKSDALKWRHQLLQTGT